MSLLLGSTDSEYFLVTTTRKGPTGHGPSAGQRTRRVSFRMPFKHLSTGLSSGEIDHLFLPIVSGRSCLSRPTVRIGLLSGPRRSNPGRG